MARTSVARVSRVWYIVRLRRPARRSAGYRMRRRTGAPEGPTRIIRYRDKHGRISALAALTVSPKRQHLGLPVRFQPHNSRPWMWRTSSVRCCGLCAAMSSSAGTAVLFIEGRPSRRYAKPTHGSI